MKHLKKSLGAAAAVVAAGALLVPNALPEANATFYPRSAYGSNPNAGKGAIVNSDNGWGSAAWPNCPSDLATAVSNSGDRVTVRSQLAPLVTELLNRTEAMGYQLKSKETGGFNCRAIGGTNRPSNHSRGRAIDLNWNSNPMAYTFKSDIPPSVVKMWESHGFYWGGRYTHKFDTMHFEFYDTPGSVNKHLANLKGTKVNPTNPPKSGSCATNQSTKIRKGARGDAVKSAQCLLAAKGYSEVGAADGIFGRKTDQAVRRFQKDKGLQVDGIVGPKTWAALKR